MDLLTPEAIISYPHLFEAVAVNEGEKKRYSCALIFRDGTDISELKNAVIEVAVEKWGSGASALIANGQIAIPFRTDTAAKGYPEGSVFFNARSTRQPGVVASYADPLTGKPARIDDPEVVFPGCIVRAHLACYAYDKPRKGVTFGLNGVQVLRVQGDDVERLDGRVAAENTFEADPDATPADFASLPGAVPDEEGRRRPKR